MQKTKKYEEHLMQALGFNEDDLEANQAGMITVRQRNALMSQRDSARFNLTIASAVALGGLALWLRLVSTSADHSDDPGFFFIIGALMIGAFCWNFGIKMLATTVDLREDKVFAIEERINLSLSTGRNGASYRIGIGDLGFPLKQDAFLAFKNGDPYRIYYTPHSKRILSVEWLRDDDNLIA